MRRLQQVRALASEERLRLGSESGTLLARLTTELASYHGIELVPVDKKAFLQGSRGELVVAEGCIYFDKALAAHPVELLELVAHEYGHLLLHHQRFRGAPDDLIRGSVFLDSGVSALSRYSPRSQEEAEASAFAAEFICPATEIFAHWKGSPESARALAMRYSASEGLIRAQLAEGLFLQVAGGDEPRPQAEVPCTPEQERAATQLGCPVIVDAGPGTGKTKTLLRRIRFLIEDRGVQPESILALTFSNEAAEEVRQRVRRQLGTDLAGRILVQTFHGLGVIVLHTLGHHVGLDVDFSILDEISQEELLSELLGRVDCEALVNIKDLDKVARDVMRHINHLKDRLIDPADLRAAIAAWFPSTSARKEKQRSEALLRLFEEYERVKRARCQVDFADLILLPQQIFSANSEARREMQAAFSYVLVDEYQDVSRATALLLRQLCGEGNPPWVVGDVRQAIYRFRGAAPSNVVDFENDFPGCRRFHLTDNYRSAPEIVRVANALAAHLDDPNGAEPKHPRWRAAGPSVALHGNGVVLAAANCDKAEREGVIATVSAWLKQGVVPDDIAVLARRNVDVRSIAIGLNANEIRAVTSGLLTAEGAAGDLAAVLTAVDHPAAVTRLVYAVARTRATPQELNSACAQLVLSDWDAAAAPEWTGPEAVRALAGDGWRILRELRAELHSGDGWHLLCGFLFFASPYLRDLLASPDDAAQSVQLEEILSTLAVAATYRFTHPHLRPRISRLGLSRRLRDLVTHAGPGLVPPRAVGAAVKVMTCHASKGLEFPCVAVAGQSLPDIPPEAPMLPPTLRPNPQDDILQAESLLFVGITRAERAAVVSYSESASGGPRSRQRRFPPLLTKLRASGAVPCIAWTATAQQSEQVIVGPVWGGEAPPELSSYHLAADTCRIRVYVQETLGARFSAPQVSLYPEFISRVRRMLRKVVDLSIAGGRVSAAEAEGIFEAEWPTERHKDHPHIALYRPRALRWMLRLLEVLDAAGATAVSTDEIEWTDAQGKTRRINLHLLGRFRDRNGDLRAVALDSGGPPPKPTTVNWSELKDYQRLPFILLHEGEGAVHPLVFFGQDGALRQFRWSQRQPEVARQRQLQDARVAFEALAAGAFDGTASDWTCDRCACRTLCPWWMGAAS